MTHFREVCGTNVSRADGFDPNDLLAVVATGPGRPTGAARRTPQSLLSRSGMIARSSSGTGLRGRFANKSGGTVSTLPNPTGICVEGTIDARQPTAGRERPKRLQYNRPEPTS